LCWRVSFRTSPKVSSTLPSLPSRSSRTIDARRLLRPFFLTPDGKQPTQYKPYYDIFTWLVTQLAFSFTTAPFILLSASASLTAWARVYFYAIIGVTACSVFLITPGKTYLQKQVKKRTTKPELQRSESQESLHGQTLGVPSEPGQEFDEMVDEVMVEIKRRRGNQAGPEGVELRRMVEDALSRKVNGGGEKDGKKGQ
jgi:lysophospholipid acyltransferase